MTFCDDLYVDNQLQPLMSGDTLVLRAPDGQEQRGAKAGTAVCHREPAIKSHFYGGTPKGYGGTPKNPAKHFF